MIAQTQTPARPATRLLLIAAAVAALALALALSARPVGAGVGQDKAWICHWTPAQWVLIPPNDSSYDAHLAHGPDVILDPANQDPDEEDCGHLPTSEPTSSPQGSVGGGTGTPAPALPDAATSLAGLSGPLATIVFGLVLLGSLGALAYANVRSVRQHR